MSTTSDDIWRAVTAERETLLELLENISEADWRQASLCDGWQVRHVVAHVIISSDPKTAVLLFNLARERGSIDRLNLNMALRYADRVGARQMLTELRACVPLRRTPMGTTPTDRLMDVMVHTQDIAVPLGLRCEMPPASARLAIERAWSRSWLFHAQERFAEFRLTATDTDWSIGTGPVVEGSIGDLLLLIAGRTARLSALTGEGTAILTSRAGVS